MSDRESNVSIIKSLKDAMLEIQNENFDVKVPQNFDGELGELAKTFNVMTESLNINYKRFNSNFQKYQSMYDSSPYLHRSVNADNVLIDCNIAYAENLGYTKEEIIGKPVTDQMAEKSLGEFKKIGEDFKKNKRVVNREIWLKRKDGTTFPVILYSNAMYDMDGNPIGSNAVLRDNTEVHVLRKKIEEYEAQIKK